MAPFMIALSAAILGRAHYVLYALKRGNRTSVVVTWAATVFVVGFWIWQFT
jgi:hypothetical protein